MHSSTLQPRATVLITTKDRRTDLVRAIESVLAQSVPVELLIVDDGSSDGTSDLVRERFPTARLIRNEEPLGIIAARNRAATEATTDILFTLDDDAAYSDANVVRRAIEDFNHPRVAAVALPLVNHISGRRIVVDQFLDAEAARQSADFLCTFVYRGGANALRRDLFLKFGGYDGTGRQGEEHTYCVRLWSAGYVVRVASYGHVDHYPEVVRRDRPQMIEYGVRNACEFAWKYVPMPNLLIHLPGVAVNAMRNSLRERQVAAGFRGLAAGCGDVVKGKSKRTPISRQAYHLIRRLIRSGTEPLSALEPYLVPIADPQDDMADHSLAVQST